MIHIHKTAMPVSITVGFHQDSHWYQKTHESYFTRSTTSRIGAMTRIVVSVVFVVLPIQVRTSVYLVGSWSFYHEDEGDEGDDDVYPT